MRILYLDKNRGYSGAEKIIVMIMKLFSSNNEVFYVSPDGKIKNIIESKGLKYVPISKASVFEVNRVIKQLSPDLIHASDFSMSVLAAICASKKIPVISHLHSNPIWLKNRFDIRSIIYAVSLYKIDQVISVSESIGEEYAYKKKLQIKNNVVNNVVNTDTVKKMAQKKTSLEKQSFDLVYLGRLYKEKNPILFCKIVKRVKKHIPTIKAEIIGDGDLNNEVKDYLKKNNLTQNVALLGYKKNPYSYVKLAKVGVITSSFEGFGLSAVEMLALGLPVVSSNVGGLKKIITQDCGKLCDEEQDYVEEIVKLLKNISYYEKKSKAAKRQVLKFSNIQDYKKKIAHIYHKAIVEKEEE